MIVAKKNKLVEFLLLLTYSIALLLALVPILVFIFGVFFYRKCVSWILKYRHQDRFHGLLKDHDALWGVEDQQSPSVINALILLECNSQHATTSVEVCAVLEEKVRLWMTQPNLAKIFCQRRIKWGYNYLLRTPLDDIRMQEYVKQVAIPTASTSEIISFEDIKKWVSEYYSLPLPNDHANFLEIIVSDKPAKGKDGLVLFPVLFRIHHSLADGVAIVKLLAKSAEATRLVSLQPSHATSKSSVPQIWSGLKNAVLAFLRIPVLLLRQRKIQEDFNSLHCGKSSAKNFVEWYFEEPGGENEKEESRASDCDDAVNLLHKIKAIKVAAADVESGVTFQDVLSASVSTVLHKHLSSVKLSSGTDGVPVPEEITFGCAVQLPGESHRLTNHCAYNFESIPINAPAARKEDLLMTLREIRLRRADVAKLQLTNYGLIKICSIMPEIVLRRILAKNRCTLGLSNIPGPLSMCLDGNLGSKFEVRHLHFWTPNRFQTRLAISVFTLGNKLHLGMGGDAVGFDNLAEPGILLEDIAKEITRMYKLVKTRE